jgi:hypothetical protein
MKARAPQRPAHSSRCASARHRNRE